MTNFTTFFVFPLAVVLAGLVIEYLIIQPLKNRANYPENQHSQFEKTDFVSLIKRLLVGLSRISINHVGASFIERFGSF